MLNDHERQVLEEIERGVLDADPTFASTLAEGRRPRRLQRVKLRHWPSVALGVAGVALLAVAAVLGLVPLMVEGGVVIAVAIGWRIWDLVRNGRAATRPTPRLRSWPRTRSSKPPEWFGQV